MFTGIVENQAILIKRNQNNNNLTLVFRFKHSEKQIKEGESIAVNGVCLTAKKRTPKGFEADVVKETQKVTTLLNLKSGDWVNVERSLRYGDRMGGHFVSGHVDGKGKIVKRESGKKGTSIWIQFPRILAAYVIPKGSIAVDGISLTIQTVEGNCLKVALIPYTLKLTTLGIRKEGDYVNLESDIFLRQKQRLKKIKNQAGLTLNHLIAQGF